jgi:hypothetical protein
MVDDAEPAATQGRYRRQQGMRPGGAAPVAHRDLDRAAVHRPGHLKPASGQRMRVQDGVAEQLADDHCGVAHGRIEDPRREQVSGEPVPGHRYAGGRTGQEHDARVPHLPEHPPDVAERAMETDLLGAEMPSRPRPETGAGAPDAGGAGLNQSRIACPALAVTDRVSLQVKGLRGHYSSR